MMTLMDQGYDVVYGQRRHRAGETAFKTSTAAGFYRLLRAMTEIDIPADTGDFRLMRRSVVEVFKSMPEQFRFIRGLVAWIGMRQVPLLYDRDPRYAGTTSYPLRKMVLFAIDAITGFSVVPLRLVSWAGLAASVGSLLMFAVTIVQWLRGTTVVGWTSLATLILVIGGVQLLFLGVLGEYVGRIYIEGKRGTIGARRAGARCPDHGRAFLTPVAAPRFTRSAPGEPRPIAAANPCRGTASSPAPGCPAPWGRHRAIRPL